MKYTVEMGSVTMTCVPVFINIGSGIHTLVREGVYRDTQTAWRSHKPTVGK
jgi:hypothetical protein